MARKLPNIVVTGTPGVGKTTHAEQLAQNLGFKHVSINQIVKDEGFHEGKDEELGSWIVDEDKVSKTQLLSYPSKTEQNPAPFLSFQNRAMLTYFA
jgi:broad-specificity NMP kinase